MQSKESRLYLKFFKEHILLILLPTAIFSLSGLYHELSKQPLYRANSIFEFNYNLSNFDNKATLVDEAVALIRSPNVQGELNLRDTSELIAHKRGPLIIDLAVTSISPTNAKDDHDKVAKYLSERFQVQKAGESILQDYKNFSYLGIFVYLFIGLSVGVSLSFIAEYFRKY